jgi:hypothetical protein
MKIIGLITAWGCDMWIEPAIKQALTYCDEVLVSVEAHHPNLAKYEDKTLEICKKYKKDITIVKGMKGNNHTSAKGSCMKKMVETSKLFKKGNWVWILDADEFYFQEDVDKCKDAMKESSFTAISLPEKCFYVNTKYYLNNYRCRLKKILNDKPTWGKTNSFGTEDFTSHIDTKKGMFHYTFLLNPYMKMDFWNIEHHPRKQPHKINWMKNVYLKYDLSKPTKNPQGPHSFKPNSDGYLFKYDGEHPKFLGKNIVNAKDFRELYEQRN